MKSKRIVALTNPPHLTPNACFNIEIIKFDFGSVLLPDKAENTSNLLTLIKPVCLLL